MIYKPNRHGKGLQKPDTIVIHAMSQYINGVHAWDILNNLGYSAHFLMEPCGEIIKCRDTSLIAYHAKGNNVNTIGIEVLVEGDHEYYQFLDTIKTDWVRTIQMQKLISLCQQLIGIYPIKEIVRHSDIDPKRKFDPGRGFDFGYLLQNLKF